MIVTVLMCLFSFPDKHRVTADDLIRVNDSSPLRQTALRRDENDFLFVDP